MQEWFKHDFRAHRDPKLVRLRIQGGYELIGIYWTLIEVIGDAEDRRWSQREYAELADELRLSEECIREAIATLIGLSLLCQDEAKEWIWSKGTHSRMKAHDNTKILLSDAGKKGAQKRWKSPKHGEAIGEAYGPPNGVPIADKIRLDKIRLDKNGESATPKIFVKPSLQELTAYFAERGATGAEAQAQHFLDHYESNGWRVGRNPMKDWRGAVRNWLRNDFTGGKVARSISPGQFEHTWEDLQRIRAQNTRNP